MVLTGEGADEMFAGYDLFREGKVRRFWATAPAVEAAPALLERLYPYLARSPVSQQAMARQVLRAQPRPSARSLASRTSRAGTRRARSSGCSRRATARSASQDTTCARLPDALAPEFSRWSPLAQDQYLEIRTLLSG